MSECRRVTDQLTAYVDDVLDTEARGHVDRHLASCPGCRDRAGIERHAQTILRQGAEQLLAEPLPPGLRGRCEALAAARSSVRLGVLGPWWRVRLVPVLLTMVVLIFTASAILAVATRRSDGVLAAQLTVDHTKCFKIFGPPSGAPADAASVQRLLAEQYGWSGHVPSSSNDHGIELLGARRCLYGDGLIPHLMYRVNGQDVSLFVLPGAARRPSDLVTLGHRSQVWTRGAATFVLVSPEGAADMARAARYVVEEAR